jgi:hypothetical protein
MSGDLYAQERETVCYTEPKLLAKLTFFLQANILSSCRLKKL